MVTRNVVRRSGAAFRRALPLAAALAVCAPREAEAQLGAAWAVPVVERFDRLADAYETVVVLPLPVEAARELQRALWRRGYDPGPVTGWIDPLTRSAIRQLQIDSALRITGLPDYDTVRLLGLPLRQATLEEVAAVDLDDFGYTPGIIVIGPDLPDTAVVAPGLGVPPAPSPAPRPTPGVEPVEPPPPPRAPGSEGRRGAAMQPGGHGGAAGVEPGATADDLPGEPAGGPAATADTGSGPGPPD